MSKQTNREPGITRETRMPLRRMQRAHLATPLTTSGGQALQASCGLPLSRRGRRAATRSSVYDPWIGKPDLGRTPGGSVGIDRNCGVGACPGLTGTWTGLDSQI
jgi:hypothetical protein